MPDMVTSAGFQCVASTYMYLNHIDGDVGSYEMYWRDIAPGVTPVAKAKGLMLGGEVSMWTDDCNQPDTIFLDVPTPRSLCPSSAACCTRLARSPHPL